VTGSRLVPFAPWWLVFTLAVGCGPSAPPPPSVTILTPVDGAVVTGPRMITVQGAVANATSVRVAVGDDAPQDAVVDGAAFSLTVTLGNRDQPIVATATGAGGSASDAVSVTYPYVPLVTFQAATAVLGAPGFDVDVSGDDTASPSSFRQPRGRPWVEADRVAVADFHAAQVLVFEPVPTGGGANASWFLGSDDGLGSPFSLDPGATYAPTSLQRVGDRLFVLETGNGRLQVFDPLPEATGAAGAFVVGKASFGDTSTACGPATWLDPEDFHVGGGRLVVADTGHHRVLVYATVPTGPGAVPDLVLGQGGFTSCSPNRGLAVPQADSLRDPSGVWTDGERLVVVDTGNHRVLVWTTFPAVPGQPANLVLGQATFGTASPSGGASGLSNPVAVDGNGNQLAVADQGNHRVLVWDAFPTTAAQPADLVLGQVSLATAVARAPSGTPTAHNLWFPSGVAFGPDTVVVLDSLERRALIFVAAY
jgi:hypothetical protein